VTDRVLHDYYKLARPCAFLNPHGECSIYEFRPNTCRLYLSKSDPTFCASDWILQGDNLNFLAELPDAVEKCIDDFNELWIDFGIPDSFFEALLWWHDFLEMKDQNHNGIDH
jgi:hypothetical protein